MGRLVIDRLLDMGHMVTCFSRDEQKQRTMPEHTSLTCTIGDIRDYESVYDVMDYNFHTVINLAALKCVDTVEANPVESIHTNVLGVQNVIRACARTSLPKLIFTSTDKACYPINVYGQCKAIAEKLVFDYGGSSTVFRYGNVLGSRGSVLSAFVSTLAKYGRANITNMEMTRFWVDSNLIAQEIAACADQALDGTDLQVKLSRTMRVVDVAKAVASELGIPGVEYKDVGIRPGEKIHETLVTRHDGLVGYKMDINSHTHDRYEFEEFCEVIRPSVAKIKSELRL